MPSIATGWSEPVPGRDLHPLKTSAFSTAHADHLINPHPVNSRELLGCDKAFHEKTVLSPVVVKIEHRGVLMSASDAELPLYHANGERRRYFLLCSIPHS